LWTLRESSDKIIKICQACAKENGLFLDGSEIYQDKCKSCDIESIVCKPIFDYTKIHNMMSQTYGCVKCAEYNEMYSCRRIDFLGRFCTKWDDNTITGPLTVESKRGTLPISYWIYLKAKILDKL